MTAKQLQETEALSWPSNLHPVREDLHVWAAFVDPKAGEPRRVQKMENLRAPLPLRSFPAEFSVRAETVRALPQPLFTWARRSRSSSEAFDRDLAAEQWDDKTFMEHALRDRFAPDIEQELERGWRR